MSVSSSRVRFLEMFAPFVGVVICIGPGVEFGRVDGRVEGPERGLDEAGSSPALDLELDLVVDGIMVSKD